MTGLTKRPSLSGSPEDELQRHASSSWCAADANGCELGLGAVCDFIIFKSHSPCPSCWGRAKEMGVRDGKCLRGCHTYRKSDPLTTEG